MTIKIFLKQALILDALIEANRRELKRLREIAESIGAPSITGDRVQSGGQTDRMGDAVAAIVDLEAEIQAEIKQYIRKRHDIRRVINGVGDDTLRLILQKRYLQGEKWENVAADLHKDLRWIFRLHDRALSEADKNVIRKNTGKPVSTGGLPSKF